ncbi:MAG TPA: dienelactone hydrolase family protein [Fimbriimonadaceae bacterium]|nr:dienelactone hydrolase family protein [Fimbriimonadaceae bacterium]
METEIRSIDIATPDGVSDARLAVPTENGRYPGVLFYMDAFGVRPTIDHWIERIAAEGFVALAPNLFYRSRRAPVIDDMADLQDPEKRPRLFEGLRPMMSLLTPDNVARDAGAYLECLSDLPQTAPGPVGVTGYCMGARVGIVTAAAFPDRVAAMAGFHGGNLATEAADSPHLLAGKIKAEVYIAFADHDQGASPEQQARLEDALTSAGIPHKIEVYEDAPHGYTMADTAAFRPDAAERHFENLIALLNRRLK